MQLLWPNVAVGIVVLILALAGQISSGRQLARVLAYSLTYANLVSILGGLAMFAIVKRLDWRKVRVAPLMVFCIVVVVPVGCLLVQELLSVMGLVVPHNFWREYLMTLRTAVPLAAIFALGAFMHASLSDRLRAAEEKLRVKDLAEERARKLAAEARLQLLEARIQPHFLFNTLNSISALISVDPARAEQMVGRLATLLRTSLDASDRPLIPLCEELAMVQSYMEIERARFGTKLRGSVDVPAALEQAKVPPMSVQTLVENAVKYGITPQPGGGEIRLAASLEGSNVRIEVCDSGPGFDLAVVPAGHGLDNLVERLNALFAENARLNVFRRDGHSVVELVLPLV